MIINRAYSATVTDSRQFCRAVPAELPFVKERALKVDVPDGREIIVIGHIHGERQAHFYADMVRRIEVPWLFPVSFWAWLNDVYTEVKRPLSAAGYLEVSESESAVQKLMVGRSTLSHQKENLDYLLQALSPNLKNHQIQFLGIEAPPSALESLKNSYLLGVGRLEKEFVRQARGSENEMSSSQFDELILGSSQAEFYLLHRHPELVRNIPFVGTVPEETSQSLSLKKIRAETKDLFNLFLIQWSLHHERNLVSALLHQKDESNRFESFNKLLHFLNDVKFQSIHTWEKFRWRLSELEAIHPSFKGPILNQILENMEAQFHADYEKNSGVAKALLAQNKSGVQFIGLAHLFFVASALEAECQKTFFSDY